jgi:hypothetical protein
MAVSAYDVKRLTLEEDAANPEELHYNFKVSLQSCSNCCRCTAIMPWRCWPTCMPLVSLLLATAPNVQAAKKLAHLLTFTSLKHLNVAFNELSSIDGIEQLQQLQSLNLSHNQLSVLDPVSSLTGLTR